MALNGNGHLTGSRWIAIKPRAFEILIIVLLMLDGSQLDVNLKRADVISISLHFI